MNERKGGPGKYDKLSSAELEKLLRHDIDDLNEPALTENEILEICGILAERMRVKPDAQAAWERFLKHYLSEA